MNLSSARDLESFYFNDTDFINNPTLHHDQSLVGGDFITETRLDSLRDKCDSKENSAIAEYGSFYALLNGSGFNHCMGNSDVDHTNMEVVLQPDYVIYQDNYYMGTKLTFSQCYIQISDSTACVKQGEGAFDILWAVDDLIDIECHLFPSNGMVLMKLRAVSSNAGPSNHVSCISGIEELKIAVGDGNWSLTHEQITSLNEKYLAIWNTVPNMEVEDGKKFPLGPRCYFPNFQESFVEVVYPKGDPDAVCLTKRDVDLLKPDTFINDTIIDFYIQYLKSKIPEEERTRFHFFNSFFFRKLVDMDKNPSGASDGKAAFQRVRKWTRKVDLFEKDYIFIPVNFNFHWSLIVICHPGEVVNFNDKEPDKSLKVPCILHMDSIKGYHSGLKNLLQSYLWEEWKGRQKDTCGVDLSSRFLNMHFLPVASPQQENSYDCGLFLLHCLELFLAEAPLNFNPFKLSKFSNFLNLDWFLPVEAYLKRAFIQWLIFELVEIENLSSHEGFSSDYSDDHSYSENNENRTDSFYPGVNGDSSTYNSNQGIEITLLSPPPGSFNPSGMVLKELFEPAAMAGTLQRHCQSLDQPSSDHCLDGSIFPIEGIEITLLSPPPGSFNPSGMVLKELFEPAAMAGTLQRHCQSLDQPSSDHCLDGSIFPIEEDTDLREEFMYMMTNHDFPQVAEISHVPEISIQSEHNKTEPSLATPSCASDDSDDIENIESFPTRNETRPSYEDERDENNIAATENYFEDLPDIPDSSVSNFLAVPLMEMSQRPNTMCAGHKDSDQHSSCHDLVIIDNMEPDNREEQPAKKRQRQN